MEKTLALIKPDAIERKLIGRIISMYEENGLTIEEMYKGKVDEEFLSNHYAEHVGRDFYPALIEFMSSGDVIAILLRGENAVEIVRQINGATNPANAVPGTIRFLFGTDVRKNCVHGSASEIEAEREIALWFGKEQ